MLTALCIAAIAMAGPPAPGIVEPMGRAATEIDTVLREAAADGSGFAVIAEAGGEVILAKGYGLAHRSKGTAFTPDTVAQIGSLTKQFTATAVLHLAEEGKIDLRAPIRTYIPGLTSAAGEASVHQLLTHSSGLPEYCGEDFDRVSREAFISDCLTRPLRFAPGADRAYSNVGYSTLALIVELVSGRTFEAYLRTTVLAPNGLEKTGYHFADRTGLEFANGYLQGRDMGNIEDMIKNLGGSWWNLKGSGGMQASARDMFLWYRALNGEGALSPRLRALLTAPHTPWQEGVAEGYGWYFRDDGTGEVRQMSHSGSDGVFFSYYWHRPMDGVFLYFVGNSGEDPTKDTLRRVLRILTKHYLSAQ